MCIREVRSYICPGPPGTAQTKVHIHKYNNLCSALWICREETWQRREVYLDYACPACTGESEAADPDRFARVMRSQNVSQIRETYVNMAAVDNYLGSWAKFINMLLESHINPVGQATYMDRVGLFLGMAREDLCKEHSHVGQYCGCDAQVTPDRLYAYNPASGVRSALNQGLQNHVMESLDGAPPNVAAEVQVRLNVLHQRRLETQGYFRGGRLRQCPRLPEPMDTHKANFEIYFERAYQEAGAIMPEREYVPQADYFDMLKAKKPVIMCLAELITQDVGLSEAHLDMTLRRLVRGAFALERTDYHLTSLFRRIPYKQAHHLLFRMVESIRVNSQGWLQSRADEFDDKHLVYELFESVFLSQTKPLTVEEYGKLDAEDSLTCHMCFETFYDAPDQSGEVSSPEARAAAASERAAQGLRPLPPPSPEMQNINRGEGDVMERPRATWNFFHPDVCRFAQGEIPVRIRDCGHGRFIPDFFFYMLGTLGSLSVLRPETTRTARGTSRETSLQRTLTWL